MAKLVRSRIEEPDTDVGEQELAGVRGTLTGLVSAAHCRGELAVAMPLLIASSALMTTYTAGEAAGGRPAAAQLPARGLVSMGGYMRIYPEREAERIAAPTLNLRATVTLSGFGDPVPVPVPDGQHRGPAE